MVKIVMIKLNKLLIPIKWPKTSIKNNFLMKEYLTSMKPFSNLIYNTSIHAHIVCASSNKLFHNYWYNFSKQFREAYYDMISI